MGKALLEAAENDVKRMGKKGLVVWGLSLPFFMKASWFKKQGYKKIDKQGMAVLLWKPFDDDAVAPGWDRWLKIPGKTAGKVNVTTFCSGWCTVMNANAVLAKKAANEFKDDVDFHEIDTYNKDNYREWHITDSVFLNGKEISGGPPVPYEKFRKMIEKQVKKLKRLK